MNKYFDVAFPSALSVAEHYRNSTTNYVFTTHAWLVSLFIDCPKDVWPGLHCPETAFKNKFIDAIKRKEIVWYAFAFDVQAELMDTSLFEFAIKLAHDLDDKFNFPRKVISCQRDVPSTTRSVIPLFKKNGVKAFTIGANDAVTAPAVPKIFNWIEPNSGENMIGMVHPGGYGGIKRKDAVMIDGYNEVMVALVHGDNSLPSDVSEIEAALASLKIEFPEAKVITGSSFEDFIEPLLARPDVIATLPVIQREMGDTWMHGVGSDPEKTSTLRLIMKARTKCIERGACMNDDQRFYRFSRLLLKGVEHTWGAGEDIYLHDEVNWENDAFHKVQNDPNFKFTVDSWLEQRSFFDMAIASLADHPLRAEIEQLRKDRIVSKKIDLAGYTTVQAPYSFNSDRFDMTIDGSTGHVTKLVDKATGRPWATDMNRLLEVQYQTFNKTDYMNFFQGYLSCATCDWAWLYFGKPGSEKNAKFTTGIYRPTVKRVLRKIESIYDHVIVHLNFGDYEHEKYGAPKNMYIRIHLPRLSGNDIRIDIIYTDKTATRAPESLWISFNPLVADPSRWEMDKLGELVSPLDIVRNGSCHLHGVGLGAHYSDDHGTLSVESVDTPVIAFGQPMPFPTPLNVVPDIAKYGFSFNLVNNIMGVNYIMWYPYISDDQVTQQSFVMRFGK